jgi:Na+/H+ antiporter NhaC
MLRGMSQPIVMLMVMAWILAGTLGALLAGSGLVASLVELARTAHVTGARFVVVSFLICCLVSTSTGTSLGTIRVAGPVLYPAGGGLGADPTILIGAILAGATFGDSISPVSDTTIASATTQDADLGGTVRSRLKYALPAGGLALLAYALMGGTATSLEPAAAPPGASAGLRPLLMLAVPALVIGLLLARRHLMEGLFFGILVATGLALTAGLIAPGELLYIDYAKFGARGLILDGMERGVGVSVFTILLMGLVALLEASGVLTRVVQFAEARVTSARGAEAWIFAALSAAVVLTTHSVVAILTVGRFARETGSRFGVSPYRRANILDVTACTYPFLFPFFIPTILAASVTAAGKDFGLPRISALGAGFANIYSWGLLAIIVTAILTGYGRERG